ncbi:DUF3275 family protein [uncultured Cardiobacterium sp.]|uniref:DUF3275 family protein n=1 Tax=uncultured Cardiobacterium sp. TaxID=417619 RepID=UPI00261D885C|nr:DUF3275 family protein [uncultured Cardiobacterium sp.]
MIYSYHSEADASLSLSASLEVSYHQGNQETLLRSNVGDFVIDEAECFENFAEGTYDGVFEIAALEAFSYKVGKTYHTAIRAILLSYSLSTPKTERERPTLLDLAFAFSEGFLDEGEKYPT